MMGREQKGDRQATGKRHASDRRATGYHVGRQGGNRQATERRQGGGRKTKDKRQASDRQATGERHGAESAKTATGRRQVGGRLATGGRGGPNLIRHMPGEHSAYTEPTCALCATFILHTFHFSFDLCRAKEVNTRTANEHYGEDSSVLTKQPPGMQIMRVTWH